MSNRIKSINLDETTEPIAASISANGGNFSKFVRECLIRYHAQTGGAMNCKRGLITLTDFQERTGATQDRLCRPFGNGRGGRCIVCWPTGAPSADDWKAYTNGPTKTITKRQKYNNLPGDHPGTSSIYSDTTHPDFVGWYQKGDLYEVVEFQASEQFNDHEWIQAQAIAQNPPPYSI